MYALTTLIIENEELTIQPGTLFPLPGELLTNNQKRFYKTAPLGWSKCPLRFAVYSRVLHDGRRLIVPGIAPPGDEKPVKSFPDYPLKLRRDAVEEFLATIVAEDERIEDSVNEELGLLTHDLRALSSEIYNVAELAKRYVEERNLQAALIKIDTVLAARDMLSLRLDIVDFSTGQFQVEEADRISVFKKVDKVKRLLNAKAVNRKISLELHGPSVGQTFGPPSFELIPYVVLQNAIKYSPDEELIEIKVSDFLNEIKVFIRSFGPQIHTDELPRIFDRRMRGAAAIASGLSGSGLGLFAAKTLIEEAFGGSVDVVQDQTSYSIRGTLYWKTTFTIVAPRVA